MSDVEKKEETVFVGDGDSSHEEQVYRIDPATEKRLIRKTDLLLMPGLALAYFTHTLDRANLGNAKTDGIEKDLGMTGNQFSLLLVLFYLPYAIFNIPWSILAKKYNSSIIIPIAIFTWGLCTMAATAATNFSGLMATRIVMGTAEAAYKPCEIGQMGFIAGAVSGLISWSVFQWSGGLHGWQYLFLIEGSITIAVALFLLIFAPRSPEKSRWYNADEARLAKHRVELDARDTDKRFRWNDAKHQCSQWQTWAFALMALMYGVGVASSSNFLPTMIKRLTKDTTKANLYTVGPNLVASVSQLTLTFLSDRYQQRATFAAGSTVFSLIAWILLGTLPLVDHPQAGYFLTYVTTSLTFLPSNLIPVWLAANVPTTTGRAVALGLNYMAMNLAGIVSSLTFRAEDAPVYAPALISVGVTQGIFMVVCLVMRWYYVRLNRKMDEGEIAFAPGMESRPEYRYAI